MRRGTFSNKTINRFGRMYAERLLANARTRPEDMPELVSHPDWLEKGEVMRDRAVQDIKGVAKKLFYEAGYSHETIQRVLGQ